MVSAPDGLGSSPERRLYSLHSGVQMSTWKLNAGGNLAMDGPLQGKGEGGGGE